MRRRYQNVSRVLPAICVASGTPDSDVHLGVSATAPCKGGQKFEPSAVRAFFEAFQALLVSGLMHRCVLATNVPKAHRIRLY